MGTTSQIDDAMAVIRAAFAESADETTMKHGVGVLETMLSSLQGAIGAQGAPAEPASSAKTDIPGPNPVKAGAPDLLDYVIGVLKSKLDEDDRQAIDLSASAHGFSAPFIGL